MTIHDNNPRALLRWAIQHATIVACQAVLGSDPYREMSAPQQLEIEVVPR